MVPNDERIGPLTEQLLRRLAAIRTDELRSKAAAEFVLRLSPQDACTLLSRLLRLRRDSPSAAGAVDAFARALQKQELDAEFVESIRSSAQSIADRLVEALLATGPAFREYDKNAEAFVDRRIRLLTLGERRALSKSRDIDMLVRLAHDQDDRVIQGLLQNPRITEREAVIIASRRPTHVQVLECVLASRFGQSRRVRRAVAHNPYAPVALAVRALAGLTTPELEEIVDDERIAADVRSHARTLAIGRRSTPAELDRLKNKVTPTDPALEQWLADEARARDLDVDDVEWSPVDINNE